jgi:mRNA-degrading endonuclease RelE of RelBE toxin-antitoxin system
MKWRLFLEIEAIDYLSSLPARDERMLRQQLRKIQEFPDNSSDFDESDEKGRLLDVSLCEGYAITYWADFADRHIKVLRIGPADS